MSYVIVVLLVLPVGIAIGGLWANMAAYDDMDVSLGRWWRLGGTLSGYIVFVYALPFLLCFLLAILARGYCDER